MAQEPVRISSTAVPTEVESPPEALRDGRALLERARVEPPTPELACALRARFRALAELRTMEAAELLCEFAAEPRLADWRDSGPRTLRTQATEALLSMGYPFALRVSPEALEQAEKETERRGSGKRSAAWVLAVLASALLLVVPAAGLYLPQVELWLLLILMLAATVLAGREDGKTVWLGVPMLGVLGIVEIATAAAFHAMHPTWHSIWLGCEILVASGAGALAAAVLFLAAWAAEKPLPKDSP